ncbi:endo 1,5-alpha-arabinase [Aspergillus homomorphus CBS 101889]|uniref:Arabinan endo-1,5-alpha-L-arabinosidase D n=1 Tax=Aspergillus homomorphus (strain CBS 101889) TaxID=1450537 RepID=A0A395HWQ3_ASPHC|nr:arabinan endo-1,5-alpha-L-arabinosidase D [Aspergillus homomorphus CBS 101889]RAL12341.1 arabinan endo-1,5-alpha-L-arabinosidase D [Aspergillus homomorphus CBS 101889]
MHLLILLATAILLCSVNARSQSEAQPQTGNISPFSQTTKYPLPNAGNVAAHDPNILQHDGAYWLFKGGIHLPMYKAPTLDGPWTQLGTVLDGPSMIPKQNRSRPWAPTTVAWKNSFYCFYSISKAGSRNSAIGVATSTQLSPGSWTDHGALINTGQGNGSDISPYTDSNAIDPSFITDHASGQPYLLYGSYWHGIYLVPLAEDLLSVREPERPNATNLVYAPDGGRVKPDEGSFMSYRKPYYYAWFSHGKCCGFQKGFPAMGKEYSIRVGRSKDVRGPFVDEDGRRLTEGGGTVVYASNHGSVYAPGGVGVLSGTDGASDVLYYHYLNTSIGLKDTDAQLGWNYLDYKDGWPVAKSGYVSMLEEYDCAEQWLCRDNGTDTSESSGTTVRPHYMLDILAFIFTGSYLWFCS